MDDGTFNLFLHLVQFRNIYFLHFLMYLLKKFLFQPFPQLLLSQPFYGSIRFCLSVGDVLHLFLLCRGVHKLLFRFFCLFLNNLFESFDVLHSNFLIDWLLTDDFAIKYLKYFMGVKFKVDIVSDHNQSNPVLNVEFNQDVENYVSISRV
jgi:hypothetical protein